MKRRGLVLPSMLLVLAGVAVLQARWFSSSVRAPVAVNPHRSADTLSSEEVQRYRSGQPQHWRACLLKQ